eukprot:g22808.t1
MQLSRSEASLTRAPGAAGAAPEPRALNAGVRVGRAGGPVRSGVGEEKHEEVLWKMQRQLQKAETMLSTCMQTVEAAWEMSAQKLAKFDEKLSELDGRLLLLNDKQQLDAASLSVNALPATPSMEPLTVASKTAPVPSDLPRSAKPSSDAWKRCC